MGLIINKDNISVSASCDHCEWPKVFGYAGYVGHGSSVHDSIMALREAGWFVKLNTNGRMVICPKCWNATVGTLGYTNADIWKTVIRSHQWRHECADM